MKRLICWMRGHKWLMLWFMGTWAWKCERCGKCLRAPIGKPFQLPKEKIRF